ncbi:MAG: (Fe-S)-binding protein, partial [Thermodesulfobacteriota bacterium]
ESLMNDIFDNPHGVNKRLNKCLLCGSCAANCPSGVNVTEIFIKARMIITGYLDLPFIKKVIFRKMLAQPKVFDKIIGIGARIQKFLLTAKHPNTNTASLKLLSPLLKDRRIMPVADIPFQQSIDKLLQNSSPTGPRVAFFTGCLIDKIFPGVGIATVKSLLHHNYKVFIPKNQGCCGIPALAAGDKETFMTLLNHNLYLFSQKEFDYIVTSCATCTSTLKKLWPSIIENQDSLLQDQVSCLAEKTMDISQFLCNITGIDAQKQNSGNDEKIVTYHDPCHLAKSLGIRKEPRQLIHETPGYKLSEMAEPDQCCGMGGSFNLYHYDISSQIGNIKKENIEATKCHTLATSCPACMMQISDMLSKGSGTIKIKHPIELYAEGL